MPIRRIKAQSPDPYLGKIQGDTELARLAHLNYVIDAINNGNGGGSITVNGNGPVTNLNISYALNDAYDANTDTYSITIEAQEPLPYKAYRAKIATESVAWPGYGYLYNWYAVTDARKLENPGGGTGLTAPNEWRVPSDTDWTTLATFAGGSSVAGGKLKSTLTSTAYPFYGWGYNSGATDDYNFGALGGGTRDNFTNAFGAISISGVYWTSTPVISRAYVKIFNAYGNQIITSDLYLNQGCSVRLVREATASELLLADGDTSDTSSLDPYTGNDGKAYVTTKIGTQIWLAQNLRETKYNDNSNITNCGQFIGGDGSDTAWINAGIADEGAVTSYLYIGSSIPYDPNTIIEFYNDVLENTLDVPTGFPVWIPTTLGFGPIYALTIPSRPWNKTHIKVTPAWSNNDNSLSFPNNLLTENSLIVQNADAGVYSINFFPFKRSVAGVATSEDLNNYKPDGLNNSYVYVEILEYTPEIPYSPYYGSGLSVALGASNLEDEEEIVALTYEINGIEYTEDLEAKKLSIQIAKIYDQLGIFDKYKV
jgi:uncharacterized protein (TIGR02145 family)